METPDKKVIDVNFDNREQATGNREQIRDVNIYRDDPQLLVHPIIRQRRQRLLIKRKMTERWFKENNPITGAKTEF